MNISFVIPAYDASATLAEAVDSIFAGNFEKGDEVIIVDDASNDATLVLARELAAKYSPDITAIASAKNKGCPASRNIGISKSKNSLIFNLDSDNVLAPGNIAKLKEELIRQDADAAVFGEQRCFPATTSRITHIWVSKPGIFTLADLFSGIANQGSGGNYLYRKAAWERVGGYWEYGGMHEAWGFAVKMLAGGAKYIAVPGTFYFHRYSHDSLYVRGTKKAGQRERESNFFIKPALPLLDGASRAYVESHPDWLQTIEKHPLYLKDGSKGADGKIVYVSLFGKAKQIIKRLLP